jgi:hypothetical protein
MCEKMKQKEEVSPIEKRVELIANITTGNERR